MNTLEKMVLRELRNECQEIVDKCHESNADSIQHNRIFIRGNALRALEIIKALEDNQTQQP